MTIIFDSLISAAKGKGKAKPQPTPGIKRKEEGFLSRLHLIQGSDKESYGYHLNPLFPAVYKLSLLPGANLCKPGVEENEKTYILWGAGIEGEEEETRSQMAVCVSQKVEIDTENREERSRKKQTITLTHPGEGRGEDKVAVQISWSTDRIRAAWPAGCIPWNETESPTRDSKKRADDDKENPPDGKSAIESEEFEQSAPPPYTEKDRSSFHLNPEKSELPHTSPPPFTSNSNHRGKLPCIEVPDISHVIRPQIQTSTFAELEPCKWEQKSPMARFKLRSISQTSNSGPSDPLLAEFILETSDQKKTEGLRGQLLFRSYQGKEWEAVVLCSLGVMMDIRSGEQEMHKDNANWI